MSKDLNIEVPTQPVIESNIEVVPPAIEEEKKDPVVPNNSPVDPFEGHERLSEMFIKQAYAHLESLVGTGKITLANSVGLTVSLMQYSETMKGVNGVMKKFIVMNTVKKYIRNNVKDPQEQTDLLIFANMTLPSMIDTFVSLDVSDMAIKAKKGAKNLFSCCCPNKDEK